ncbi:MAG TPA: hypothetical protein VF054_07165 [Micromonosporaceae bacterium]
MTIIAYAKVPGAIPLARVETLAFPRVTQPNGGCPAWCRGGSDCWHAPLGYLDQGERHHHGAKHSVTVPGTFVGETETVTVQAARLDPVGETGTAHVYLATEGVEGWELSPEQADALAFALTASAAEARMDAPRMDAVPDNQGEKPQRPAAKRAASGCRPWCVYADQPGVCGGECMAEPATQPATAGQYIVADMAATFPTLTTFATIPAVGKATAVRLEVGGPSPFTGGGDMSGWADLTPAEARTLAYRLLADADMAEADQRRTV